MSKKTTEAKPNIIRDRGTNSSAEGWPELENIYVNHELENHTTQFLLRDDKSDKKDKKDDGVLPKKEYRPYDDVVLLGKWLETKARGEIQQTFNQAVSIRDKVWKGLEIRPPQIYLEVPTQEETARPDSLIDTLSQVHLPGESVSDEKLTKKRVEFVVPTKLLRDVVDERWDWDHTTLYRTKLRVVVENDQDGQPLLKLQADRKDSFYDYGDDEGDIDIVINRNLELSFLLTDRFADWWQSWVTNLVGYRYMFKKTFGDDSELNYQWHEGKVPRTFDEFHAQKVEMKFRWLPDKLNIKYFASRPSPASGTEFYYLGLYDGSAEQYYNAVSFSLPFPRSRTASSAQEFWERSRWQLYNTRYAGESVSNFLYQLRQKVYLVNATILKIAENLEMGEEGSEAGDIQVYPLYGDRLKKFILEAAQVSGSEELRSKLDQEQTQLQERIEDMQTELTRLRERKGKLEAQIINPKQQDVAKMYKDAVQRLESTEEEYQRLLLEIESNKKRPDELVALDKAVFALTENDISAIDEVLEEQRIDYANRHKAVPPDEYHEAVKMESLARLLARLNSDDVRHNITKREIVLNRWQERKKVLEKQRQDYEGRLRVLRKRVGQLSELQTLSAEIKKLESELQDLLEKSERAPKVFNALFGFEGEVTSSQKPNTDEATK